MFSKWLVTLLLAFTIPAHAGITEGEAAYGRGDFDTAVREYSAAARQGDMDAQASLAAMYKKGEGVAKNAAQAAFWRRKAAEQGHVASQGALGAMLELGDGVVKDVAQAAFWYRRSAEQGDAFGQMMLASLYERGEGVSKDQKQALVWWRKAADQGDALAQFSLGARYAEGEGVAKDAARAAFWYQKAAEQGDVEAKRALDAMSVRQLPTDSAPAATGTGFFVKREHVVTNHHVVQGCHRLRVGRKFSGRVVTSDPQNDLALIVLSGAMQDAATIRVGRVMVGEQATVAGFPLSGLLSGFNVTTGNVSSLAGIGGDTRLLQITAPVQAGNSGGPLLDAGGYVIGIVVSKLDSAWVAKVAGDVPQNVNFAINANVLASFLDANGINYKSSPAGSKLSTPEVAKRAQAFTVLVECWK